MKVSYSYRIDTFFWNSSKKCLTYYIATILSIYYHDINELRSTEVTDGWLFVMVHMLRLVTNYCQELHRSLLLSGIRDFNTAHNRLMLNFDPTPDLL